MGITYNSGTNTITVTGYTSETPCTFTDIYNADIAGGWGKTTVQGLQTQINCRLIIGDDSTETWFSDSNKQVSFLSTALSGTTQSAIYVRNNAYFTLGVLINAADKTSYNGISIIDSSTYDYHFLINGVTGCTINLYSCKFINSSASNVEVRVYGSKIYNCSFDNHVEILNSLTSEIYNVLMNKAQYALLLANPTSTTVNKMFVTNPLRYIYWQTAGSTVSNFYGRGCSDVAFRVQNFPVDTSSYLINVDVDVWTFNWGGSNASAKVYRQYEFDLTVTDSACNPLEGATITLTKGDTVLDLETDSNGDISTQTLTYGYYNQANGNTIQDSGNWTLTIEADGYIPYTASCLITEKTKLHISLHPQLSGDATEADVAAGKTFYSSDADTQLTGTANFGGGGYLYIDRPVVKEVIVEKENPVNTTLLALTANLIQQKRVLKQEKASEQIKMLKEKKK